MKYKGLPVLALLVFVSAALFSQSFHTGDDDQLPALLDSFDLEPGKVATIDQFRLDRMLDYADASGHTLFELLNLVILKLQAENQRVRVHGDILRDSRNRYDLGHSKIFVIFPLDRVIAMEFGAPLKSGQHALDVWLDEPYSSDFYGFGILHEDTHFGFADVELNYFRDAFGMKAKRFFFSFEVSHLYLYDYRLVEIHLDGLGKPKREKFWAVERLNGGN